jgi:hypothetical protein
MSPTGSVILSPAAGEDFACVQPLRSAVTGQA